MEYRNNEIYIKLEQIIESAGVTIEYGIVPNDSIDGNIWARSDERAMKIIMPTEDVFSDEVTACRILGHEFAHILGRIPSVDYDPVRREVDERSCDAIGAYMVRLAEMIVGHEAESILINAIKNQG